MHRLWDLAVTGCFYQGRINSEQDFLGIRRHFDIYDKKKLIQ